jgi:hypothetical protein
VVVAIGGEAPTGLGWSGGWSEIFWVEVLLFHVSSTWATRALATLTGLGIPGREWEQDSGEEAREGGMENTWLGLSPVLRVNTPPAPPPSPQKL